MNQAQLLQGLIRIRPVGRSFAGVVVVPGRSPDEPRTKRQRLGAELRRVRDLSGISGRELAQRIGISQSKVSRIESGTAMPSLPEVTAWAEAVGASAETRAWLVGVTEATFTEVHTWRDALQAQVHLQGEIEEREARARVVRSFQPSVVPGLLQTAEYARRVFSMFQVPYTKDDLAAAVAGRMDRQLALYDEGRRFDFLITEAALRWRPGPTRSLLAQLDRIASLSSLDNVSIGLIPHSQQAVTTASHGFVIYEGHDGEEETFVTVETIHANLIVNDADDVALYQSRWSLLQQMALFHDDARKLLAALGAEIRSTGG